MICKCCGAEIVAGKRFCQKCGMPAVDHSVRPEEEEIEEKKTIAKRIRELKPIVEAIREKERKEKEEAEKKRLEELEEARRKREAELMALYGEEEEILEDEDDYENEETLDEGEEILDSEEMKIVPSKSKSDDKERKHVSGALTVTQLVEDSGVFSGTKICFCGKVCYYDEDIDGLVFNLEDEDESVKCFVEYPNTDIEYDGLLYTRDDIESIISGIKRGDDLIVEGIVALEENGDPLVNIISIEGADFYIRCAN